MIKMTAEKIAEVAMVGVAKVKKDISKGKLDSDSLMDIIRYIQGYRMLAGGLKVWDGIMESVSESAPEKIEPSANGLPELWSGTELLAMQGMVNTFGKTRAQAEREIRKFRDELGVERLEESHMEELGL